MAFKGPFVFPRHLVDGVTVNIYDYFRFANISCSLRLAISAFC